MTMEVTPNGIENRQFWKDIPAMEAYIRDYRGTVWADMRTPKYRGSLIDVKYPQSAIPLDMATFRRAKNDEDAAQMEHMNALLQQGLTEHGGASFRAAAESEALGTMHKEIPSEYFTQYRGAVRTPYGLQLEAADVSDFKGSRAAEWENIRDSVYRGFAAVRECAMTPSVTSSFINNMFKCYLPEDVTLENTLVNHVGYGPGEPEFRGTDAVQAHDVLQLKAFVGYRGVHALFTGPKLVLVPDHSGPALRGVEQHESNEDDQNSDLAKRIVSAF